ncbi:hypothetical protein BDW02DRAFT_169889 [Decorospora gaudefroyi]|uniref:Uncharacterized protein n=1 Tax=Decorospora gaudefroyi TaxID=184978 RepID=A0A6A5K7M0_9PLEO|nr:hypothetical protein BDW02DRAFT_169889 [Decorospora gaudefroyi]
MKRKMEDLETMMEETLTLCRTPPVPRKHPYREFYQYRKSLPSTPTETPEMEMVGPPMFHFGSQPELVPKPLFSRSKTLPPQPHPFHADIVKSPSPLFSRRNTLPPRLSRYTTAGKGSSPLKKGAQSSRPTSFAYAEFASPQIQSPDAYDFNTNKRNSFPTHVSRVATVENRPPLFSRKSARPPAPSHFAPGEPPSPIILSPITSNAGSGSTYSSPTPSLCSSDVASFNSSTPSTPATSPPSSPTFHTRPLTRNFAPSCWTVAPSSTPVYSPPRKLRRRKSPRKDTLRGLRAKESDACLQRIYDERTSAYLNGSMFSGKLLSSGLNMVLETPEEDIGRSYIK